MTLPNKKPGICIVGMHRTGTSCLAGSLQLAGLQSGKVVEWAPFNTKGNRENHQIRDLNDAVLANTGGLAEKPPSSIAWTCEQAQRRDALIQMLEALPGDHWGFKDPRATLTLNFWLEGRPDLRVVASYRHPMAVANSLAHRQQMPLEEGIRLWQLYNERLLAHAQTHDISFICFDVPQEEYLRAVQSLIISLGLSPPKEDFFAESLRHQSWVDGRTSAVLPAEAIELYEELNQCYRRQPMLKEVLLAP